MTDEQKKPGGPTGGDLVEQLRAAGQLDALFAQIDAGEVALTGDGGFVPALVKAALERGLQAELSSHLGYEKGSREASKHANSRNGTAPKTVRSEVGPIILDVPRDRAGSFTPRLVPKSQRRLGGLDDLIISLYAGGMTIRDIQHPHSARTYPTRRSRTSLTRCSRKSRRGRPGRWRTSIPSSASTRTGSRSGRTARSSPVRPISRWRVDLEGIKHVLGIWVQDTEGSAFWAHVCTDLTNRGLIVCCDGLKGLPEAVEATWPDSMVQTCVVDLIRASMRFVAHQDRKKVSAALKPIYTEAYS